MPGGAYVFQPESVVIRAAESVTESIDDPRFIAMFGRLSRAEVDERRPVWDALSCLFLRTETEPLEGMIIEKLARSPYTLDEIEDILVREVRPVCRWNALVWDHVTFDEDWLVRAIRRRKSRLVRFPSVGPMVRAFLALRPQWRRIRRGVVRVRKEPMARGHGA